MEKLFLLLLNMSITASWMAVAVMVIRILCKKSPKWIMGVLWALVAVRLCLPFSFESVLSLVPSKETLPQEFVTSPAPVIDSGITVINSAVNPIISDALAPEVGASVNPAQVAAFIASRVWVVGMAAMLLYMLISYIVLRLRVRESVDSGLKDGVRLCDSIASPFILGVIRPKIYVPSDISRDDLLFVLAHERAHIKRCDHLWKPFGFVLLSVYWFNPMLWVAYALMCRDIELACDEKVIKSLGVESKKPYSQALVNCSSPRHLVSACPLAFGEVGVKERIKRVLNYKEPTFWVIVAGIVAVTAIITCFMTDPKQDRTLPMAFASDRVQAFDGVSSITLSSDIGLPEFLGHTVSDESRDEIVEKLSSIKIDKGKLKKNETTPYSVDIAFENGDRSTVSFTLDFSKMTVNSRCYTVLDGDIAKSIFSHELIGDMYFSTELYKRKVRTLTSEEKERALAVLKALDLEEDRTFRKEVSFKTQLSMRNMLNINITVGKDFEHGLSYFGDYYIINNGELLDELFDTLMLGFESSDEALPDENGAPDEVVPAVSVHPTGGAGYISATYGERWGVLHTGIDFAGVDHGSPIYAAASGVVESAFNGCTHDHSKKESCGCGNGLGNYCNILHGGGFTTCYANAAEITVRAGDRVEAGDIIGYIGSTGFSTGDHLHFEMALNGEPIDPEPYFDAVGSETPALEDAVANDDKIAYEFIPENELADIWRQTYIGGNLAVCSKIVGADKVHDWYSNVYSGDGCDFRECIKYFGITRQEVEKALPLVGGYSDYLLYAAFLEDDEAADALLLSPYVFTDNGRHYTPEDILNADETLLNSLNQQRLAEWAERVLEPLCMAEYGKYYDRDYKEFVEGLKERRKNSSSGTPYTVTIEMAVDNEASRFVTNFVANYYLWSDLDRQTFFDSYVKNEKFMKYLENKLVNIPNAVKEGYAIRGEEYVLPDKNDYSLIIRSSEPTDVGGCQRYHIATEGNWQYSTTDVRSGSGEGIYVIVAEDKDGYEIKDIYFEKYDTATRPGIIKGLPTDPDYWESEYADEALAIQEADIAYLLSGKLPGEDQ